MPVCLPFLLLILIDAFQSKKTPLSNDTTDTSQFFHQYIQVIGPLLIDCWIEAKPEDSSWLLSYQSEIVK